MIKSFYPSWRAELQATKGISQWLRPWTSHYTSCKTPRCQRKGWDLLRLFKFQVCFGDTHGIRQFNLNRPGRGRERNIFKQSKAQWVMENLSILFCPKEAKEKSQWEKGRDKDWSKIEQSSEMGQVCWCGNHHTTHWSRREQTGHC